MNELTVSRSLVVRLRRRPRLLLIGASLGALGLAVLGAGTVYVFSTRPVPAVVSGSSGVAGFNFRVTGIPVPGVVPGVQVHATWTPASLKLSTAIVQVDLRKLNTGIALRDRHAREFLGVNRHPVAVFRLGSIQGVGSLKAGQQVQALTRGVLTLNGMDHPLVSSSTLALNRAGTTLDVITRFDVVFSEYGITIPGADPKTDVTVQFRLAAPSRPRDL